MTLRRQIKQATAAAHRRVDEGLDLTGDVSRAHLARSLQLLHRLARGFEQACQLQPTWGPSVPRAAWLAHDLAAIGAPELPPLPLQIPPGPPALGAHYVLEGSSLGARVIARSFATQHRFDPVPTYFQQLATLPASRWPAFLATLEQHEAQAAAIEATAVHVFDVLADAVDALV